MTRSEMWCFIQKHDLAVEFKAKYNKAFTNGKNTELETFIAEHSKGDVKAHIDNDAVSCEGKKVALKDIEKPKNFNTVKAIIKMVTVLQSEDVITAEEAQEVLDELNAE